MQETRWAKAAGVGVLAFLATLLVVSLVMSAWMPGSGMMAWMWVWMLLPLLLVVGLVVLVVVLVQRRGPERAGQALEAAQQRYARGEISRDEYLRIRDDLGL